MITVLSPFLFMGKGIWNTSPVNRLSSFKNRVCYVKSRPGLLPLWAVCSGFTYCSMQQAPVVAVK